MPRPQSTSRQAEPKITQVMHLCVYLYLSLCVYLPLPLSLLVRVNALKMLHKLLPKHKYVSKCVCLSLYLSLSISLSLSLCAAAAVYCELQLQNAHAAISRFVSSPSAKINMFVPGKTPLCHFSTFTLALQVRQAMPRPCPASAPASYWACGIANANATAAAAAKVNALQENALHTHRRSQGRTAGGCTEWTDWAQGRDRQRLAHFATIKCHETLKVLSESANEAHETEKRGKCQWNAPTTWALFHLLLLLFLS